MSSLLVPSDASDTAVVGRPHPHPIDIAAGVPVVDRHIAVHAVAVRADHVLRIVRDQLPRLPDPHPLVVHDGVQPAVRR